MHRRLVPLLLAASIGATACAGVTDSDKPNGSRGSLIIRSEADTAAVADTVVVGDQDWLMVVGDTTASVSWTVSDTSIVSILEQYFYRVRVRALRLGQVTVTARHDGDSGTFALVVRELRASDTALVVRITTPARDSAIAGDSIPFGFNLTNARGDFFFGRPFTITMSDSTVVQVIDRMDEHGFWFQALKVGRTFVKVTSQGTSDSSEIIVHEPPPTVADPRARRYEAIDLGTLGGETAFPFALNDNGEVVGYSLTADGKQHAFVWADGVLRDLSLPDDVKGAAHVVTNAGVIAGTTARAGLPVQIVVWKDGVRTDLGPVGCCDQQSTVIGITATEVVARGDNGSAIWQNGVKQDLALLARAMNSNHQIVGTSANRPVIWDNGVLRDLEVWWGPGDAVDINSSGAVVGQLGGSSGAMGVLWVNGLFSRDFGWTLPAAINDAGDVATDVAGTGYFLDHREQWTTLGPMASGTKVAAMNDQAMIVGFNWTASKKQHAFVWQPGEPTPIDLGAGPAAADRQGSAATAINARGDIIGWAAPCTTPSGRCTELDLSRARAILWRLR